MGAPRGDAEATKARILAAARRLFAEQDLASVSIRDIAAAAGVSHGLVQRYFGTREEMVAAIIRREVDDFAAAPPPLPSGRSPQELAELREGLRAGMDHFRDYARLIMRAELAGIEPETMLDPSTPTPGMRLADAIAALQAGPAPGGSTLDARVVSAYINASLFAFSAMSPWLMASVGISPEDYEEHLDAIVDISVGLISRAIEPPR